MSDAEAVARSRTPWDWLAPACAAILAASLVLVLAPWLVPVPNPALGSATNGIERGRWASVAGLGASELDATEALLRMRRPPDVTVRWSGNEWERESWEGQLLPRFGCDRDVWPDRFVPMERVFATARAKHPGLPRDPQPE
jgi:hypothetical protein